VEIEGRVELGRAGAPPSRRLTATPEAVRDGDLVVTRRDGRAEIRFKDGSLVDLSPNAVFTVEEETTSRIALFVSIGKLWAKVSSIRSGVSTCSHRPAWPACAAPSSASRSSTSAARESKSGKASSRSRAWWRINAWGPRSW